MSKAIQRAKEIADREGADCFVSLVREYAESGFSEYAIARRLLEIDVGTMRRYLAHLGSVVVFKKYGDAGYQHWDCRKETAESVRASRERNGTLRLLTKGGETKPISVWSAETGINKTTIEARIDRYGWTEEEALSTPAYGRMGAKRPHKPKRKKGELEWLFVK